MILDIDSQYCIKRDVQLFHDLCQSHEVSDVIIYYVLKETVRFQYYIQLKYFWYFNILILKILSSCPNDIPLQEDTVGLIIFIYLSVDISAV